MSGQSPDWHLTSASGIWRTSQSDWNGYGADFGNFPSFDTWASSGAKDGMGFNAKVGVGPYSAVILLQN